MKPLQPIEHIAVENLILDIKKANNSAVKFTIDNYIINLIGNYLKVHDYKGLMYSCGHSFILELLRCFEKKEIYEGCEFIVKAIKEHNKLTNDKLSTR